MRRGSVGLGTPTIYEGDVCISSAERSPVLTAAGFSDPRQICRVARVHHFSTIPGVPRCPAPYRSELIQAACCLVVRPGAFGGVAPSIGARPNETTKLVM